jgi:hypothetical protein
MTALDGVLTGSGGVVTGETESLVPRTKRGGASAVPGRASIDRTEVAVEPGELHDARVE